MKEGSRKLQRSYRKRDSTATQTRSNVFVRDRRNEQRDGSVNEKLMPLQITSPYELLGEERQNTPFLGTQLSDTKNHAAVDQDFLDHYLVEGMDKAEPRVKKTAPKETIADVEENQPRERARAGDPKGARTAPLASDAKKGGTGRNGAAKGGGGGVKGANGATRKGDVGEDRKEDVVEDPIYDDDLLEDRKGTMHEIGDIIGGLDPEANPITKVAQGPPAAEARQFSQGWKTGIRDKIIGGGARNRSGPGAARGRGGPEARGYNDNARGPSDGRGSGANQQRGEEPRFGYASDGEARFGYAPDAQMEKEYLKQYLEAALGNEDPEILAAYGQGPGYIVEANGRGPFPGFQDYNAGASNGRGPDAGFQDYNAGEPNVRGGKPNARGPAPRTRPRGGRWGPRAANPNDGPKDAPLGDSYEVQKGYSSPAADGGNFQGRFGDQQYYREEGQDGFSSSQGRTGVEGPYEKMMEEKQAYEVMEKAPIAAPTFYLPDPQVTPVPSGLVPRPTPVPPPQAGGWSNKRKGVKGNSNKRAKAKTGNSKKGDKSRKGEKSAKKAKSNEESKKGKQRNADRGPQPVKDMSKPEKPKQKKASRAAFPEDFPLKPEPKWGNGEYNRKIRKGKMKGLKGEKKGAGEEKDQQEDVARKGPDPSKPDPPRDFHAKGQDPEGRSPLQKKNKPDSHLYPPKRQKAKDPQEEKRAATKLKKSGGKRKGGQKL